MTQFNHFESFEGRRLMSVVPVLNNNNDGAGSLRRAIADAAPGDTLDLTALTGTINLTSAPLTVERLITVIGPGPGRLSIVGNGATPVFINSGGNLTVKDVTITGGGSISSGGGFFTTGPLTLDNVKVLNNRAFLFGGGIYAFHADVTLNDTTLKGNIATGALEASGGAIYMDGGKLTVTGSTFSHNQAIGQTATSLGITAGPANGGAGQHHRQQHVRREYRQGRRRHAAAVARPGVRRRDLHQHQRRHHP